MLNRSPVAALPSSAIARSGDMTVALRSGCAWLCAACVVLAWSVAAADVIPDATLRAVTERRVRLELAGKPAVEGRLLAFEDATISIALAETNEVVTIARADVARVIAVPDAAGPPAAAAPAVPEKLRVVGLHSSLLGTVAVDIDYKYLHGFASVNLLAPIITASGDSRWMAGAVGAGYSRPLGASGRWRLDVFAVTTPLRTTSHYTYLGFGLGAGFHYTAASGFNVGITFPVVGFATRLGSSPTGYDGPYRYNDSIGYYYLAGLAGMPLLTMGYRFATRCPRKR
jgi:hypothetical protein